MPTYALRCPDCQAETEASASIHDSPPDNVPCPCGGTSRRVISWGGTAVLKGRGWAKHPERETATYKKGPQD